MTPKNGTPTRRRHIALAALAATAAVGTAVAAPAAQAAPSGSRAASAHAAVGASFTLLPGAAATTASVGSARVVVTRSSKVSPNITINCQVTASPPFRFYGGPFPYPSGVEGLAHVNCDNVVNSIDLLVVLFRGTTAVASNERVSYYTTQSAADTEYQYSAGWTWQTGAQAAVVFPDGSSGVSSPAYSAATYIP